MKSVKRCFKCTPKLKEITARCVVPVTLLSIHITYVDDCVTADQITGAPDEFRSNPWDFSCSLRLDAPQIGGGATSERSMRPPEGSRIMRRPLPIEARRPAGLMPGKKARLEMNA